MTIEQLLLAEGLAVGATVSPHVRSWDERIRLDGGPADLAGRARARPAGGGTSGRDPVRDDHRRRARPRSRTREVDVAVVEAGLGGRYDATNVLRSRVVLLTNVGLEHTDVLGDTVEAIATEKLAVVHTDDTIVVLPDDTFAALVPRGRIVRRRRPRGRGGVRRPSDRARPSTSRFPAGSSGGPARSATEPTTPTASPGCARACRPSDYTICASILADKDVDEMLRRPRRARRAASSRRSPRMPGRSPRSVLAERARRSLRHGRGGRGSERRAARVRTRSASPSSSPARSICSPISRRPRVRDDALTDAGTDHRAHLRARRPARPSSELRSPPGISSASSSSEPDPIACHRRHLLRLEHLDARPAT